MGFIDFLKKKEQQTKNYFGLSQKGLGTFGNQVINPVRNVTVNPVINQAKRLPSKISGGVNNIQTRLGNRPITTSGNGPSVEQIKQKETVPSIRNNEQPGFFGSVSRSLLTNLTSPTVGGVDMKNSSQVNQKLNSFNMGNNPKFRNEIGAGIGSMIANATPELAFFSGGTDVANKMSYGASKKDIAKSVGGTILKAGLAKVAPKTIKIPAISKIASPSARLALYSGVRGLENAAYNTADRLQKEGRMSSLKEAGTDLITGAAFNASFSPKLTANATRELSKSAVQKARLGIVSSLQGKELPNTITSKILPNGVNVNDYTSPANGYTKEIVPNSVADFIFKNGRKPNKGDVVVNNFQHKGNTELRYINGRLAGWDSDNPRFISSIKTQSPSLGLSTVDVSQKSPVGKPNTESPIEVGQITSPQEKNQINTRQQQSPKLPTQPAEMPTNQSSSRLETPVETKYPTNVSNPQLTNQERLPQEQPSSSSLKNQKIPSFDNNLPQNRGFVDTTKLSPRTTAETVAKIEGEYTRRSNKELVATAQARIAKDSNEALRFARTNTSDEAIAVGTLLSHQYQKAGNSQMAADLVNEMSKKLTEAGRTAQAASLWDSLSPEGIGQLAANAVSRYNEKAKVKIPELTGEQYNKVVEWAAKVQNMAEGRAQNLERQKLLEHISTLTPSPLFKKFIAVIKAGLLTGVKTTEVNTISNAVHGGMEVVKDIPASMIDSAISLLTGKRTKTFTIKGSGKGTKEGFAKGWDYLVSGYDERNVGEKLDYHRVNFGPKFKWLQNYEESIFRFIGSQDQPFYYGAKARSIADQAIVDAKNLGLKGNDFKIHVQKLMENPTEEIATRAVQDAERAVFQNSTVAGDVAKKIQQAGGGVGELIVPFGKTPSAVGTQVVNYSPIGLIKGIVENIGKGRFDQRAFSEAMGRGLVGTGIWAIGSALMAKGLMTLSAPTNDKERKQWELEGKTPNSIKIGNKWMQASSLGPGGNALIAGGYLQQGYKEGGLGGAVAQAGAGQLKSVADQPFLKGPSGIINAVNDPTRYAQNAIENTVGMLVPTQVSDIARSTDPLQREQNTKLEAITNKIPILREKNTPKKDAFGQDLKRSESAIGTYLDPMRSSVIKSDPITSELNRLMESGNTATPGTINKSQTIGGQKVKLNPEQLNQLEEKSGGQVKKMFTEIISDPEYQSMSDENKAKILNNIIDNVRGVEKSRVGQGIVDPTAIAKSVLDLSKEQKGYLSNGTLDVTIPKEKKVISPSSTQVSAAMKLLSSSPMTNGDLISLISSVGTSRTIPKLPKAKTAKKGTIKKVKVSKVSALKSLKLKVKVPKFKKVAKFKIRRVA